MPWEEIGAKNHIVHEAQFRVGEEISQLEEDLAELAKDQARKIPRKVTNIVKPFKLVGRKDSKVGVIIVQFSRLPPIIAPKPSATMGVIIEGV